MKPRTTITALTVVAALIFLGALTAGSIGFTADVSPPDDVKGPCDEPEHVNDPECRGPQEPEDNFDDEPDATPTPGDGDELKGNCDEAEHVNDPECRGPQEPEDNFDDDFDDDFDDRDEDNSGPSENSGPGNAHDDDADEDNSGPSENSGPGNAHDDDADEDNSGPSANSGPGNADDDDDDDDSGPGSE